MHLALRNYKDGDSTAIRRHDAIRLAAILWRFLRDHELCIASAAGVDELRSRHHRPVEQAGAGQAFRLC